MTKKKLYEILIILLLAVMIAIPKMVGSESSAYETGEDGETIPSLTKADLNHPGTRIAVLTGSELYTAATENFPDATPVQYDTFADVFYALDTGKTEAALGFDTNIPLVRQSYPGLAVISEKVAEYSYGFGTLLSALICYLYTNDPRGRFVTPPGYTNDPRGRFSLKGFCMSSRSACRAASVLPLF